MIYFGTSFAKYTDKRVLCKKYENDFESGIKALKNSPRG